MIIGQQPYQYDHSRWVLDACWGLLSYGTDILYRTFRSAMIISQIIPPPGTSGGHFFSSEDGGYQLKMTYTPRGHGGVFVCLNDDHIDFSVRYPHTRGKTHRLFSKIYGSNIDAKSMAACYQEMHSAIWDGCTDPVPTFNPYWRGPLVVHDSKDLSSLPTALTFSTYMKAVTLYALLPFWLQADLDVLCLEENGVNFSIKYAPSSSVETQITNDEIFIVNQNHGIVTILAGHKNKNMFEAANNAAATLTYHLNSLKPVAIS